MMVSIQFQNAAEDVSRSQKKKVTTLKSKNSGFQTLLSDSAQREVDLCAELNSLHFERDDLVAKFQNVLEERKILVDKVIEAESRVVRAEEILAQERAEVEAALATCLW